MNEKAGVVFSIAKENAPVPYCTISKNVVSGKNSITYFSLAANTDISAESHPERKLLIVNGGDLEVFTREGQSRFLKEGEFILLPSRTPAATRSKEAALYPSIALQIED